MSTSVTTITKAISTITTRLETNPNSLVEYVTTETIKTGEDGTESKSESTKKYVLEEIDAYGHHSWYNRAGQLHRDGDLPAIILANGVQQWYKDGKRHRDGDLPAFISAIGDQYWYKDGKLHRDGDLPAFIDADGRKSWFRNGIQYTPSCPEIKKDKLLAALESLQLGLAELTKELTSH
jgi:hypothetical protein